MVNKYRSEMGPTEPVQEGEFRRISGIGPGIEQRLHAAGIRTFQQLGALSTEEILTALSGLVGITRERITQQDWPAQARRFGQEIQQRQASSQTADANAHADELHNEAQLAEDAYEPPMQPLETALEPETDRRSYESIMVELLMDENRQVRRTRVVHVQRGEKSTWAGWDQARLTQWIAEQFNLNPIQTRPQPALGGQVNIRSLNFLPLSGGSPTHFVDPHQPFQVRLALDLSQVQAREETPLAYQVEIEAHQLGAEGKVHLGAASGTLALEESTEPVLTLEAGPLPDGTYRIEAMLLLHTPGAANAEALGLRALFEGEILQVFAGQMTA